MVSQTGPEGSWQGSWLVILVHPRALVPDTLWSASPTYEALGGQLTDPGTQPPVPWSLPAAGTLWRMKRLEAASRVLVGEIGEEGLC